MDKVEQEVSRRDTHRFLRMFCGLLRTTHGSVLMLVVLIVVLIVVLEFFWLSVQVVSIRTTGTTPIVFGVTVVPTGFL